MRKKTLGIILYSLIMPLVILGAAVSIDSAIYSSTLQVINTGADKTAFNATFNISGHTLVNSGFIDADGLNAAIADGDTLVRSQLPSQRLTLNYCIRDVAGTSTDFSTECNDVTEDDFNFFSASGTPVANDAFYFGMEFPWRILSFSIGTAGVGDWILEWEFYNGSAWVELPNIDDRTDFFREEGLKTVSWDIPPTWEETTVDSNEAYWVRARVTNWVTHSILPLGNFVEAETGIWWIFLPEIDSGSQLNYQVGLGGPDMVTGHAFFPGEEGYVTPDDAALEIGTDIFSLDLTGYFITDGLSATSSIMRKEDALRIYNPSDGVIEAQVATSTVLSVSGINSGEFTISLTSDGGILSLTVENVNSDSTTAVEIPDNSNNWEWGTLGSVKYFTYISLYSPLLETITYEGDLEAGTLTGTEAVTPDSIVDNIFVTGALAGLTHDGTDLWVVAGSSGTAELRQIDPSDGTLTSFCSTPPGDGSTRVPEGVTWDGSTFYILDRFLATIQVVDSSCTLSTSFSTPAGTTGCSGIAFDGTDLWIGCHVSNDPELHRVNTSGTVQETFALSGITGSSIQAVAWDGTNIWVSSTTAIWKLDSNGEEIFHFFHVENLGAGVGLTFESPTGNSLWTSLSGNLRELDISRLGEAFVYIEEAGFDSDDNSAVHPVGWADEAGFNSTSQVSTVNATDGTYSFHMGVGNSTNSRASLTSPIFETSEGELWSAAAEIERNSTTHPSPTLIVHFRDSGDAIVQTDQSPTSIGSVTTARITLEGLIAPANTAGIQLTIEGRCILSFCSSSNVYWDEVMLVNANTVPTFPSATNVLTNPSFEKIYPETATWISTSTDLSSIIDPESTRITWVETTPDDSEVLIETSIDSQASWQEATNGGPIPGVTSETDLSSSVLFIRATLSSSTDQEDTPTLVSVSFQVLDSNDVLVTYQPQELIGRTLSDISENGHSATVSYPSIPSSTLTTSLDALVGTGNVTSPSPVENHPEVGGDAGAPDGFNIPDGSLVGSNLPLSGIILFIATFLEVDTVVVWTAAALWIIFLVGVAAMKYLNSVPAAGGGMIFTAMILTQIGNPGLIPLWIILLAMVMIFGIMLVTRKNGGIRI